MNQYTTVYDLSTEPYDWVWPLFCVALLLIAGLVYYYVPHWPHRRELLRVALLLGFLTGLAPYLYERWMLRKQLNGNCTVVTGLVTHYWTRREYRLKEDTNDRTVKVWSTYEGFRVNDVPFTYLVNASAPYFHNAGKDRLSIQDGMVVRIGYVAEPDLGGSFANRILKLEVGSPTIQSHQPTTQPVKAALD